MGIAILILIGFVLLCTFIIMMVMELELPKPPPMPCSNPTVVNNITVVITDKESYHETQVTSRSYRSVRRYS